MDEAGIVAQIAVERDPAVKDSAKSPPTKFKTKAG
jgi:hypothetical protein